MSNEESRGGVAAGDVAADGSLPRGKDVSEPQVNILSDPKAFISNIATYFNQEALSDVQLEVGEKQYFGHKFVLANSSDVLRVMLYDKNWSDGKTTKISLSELDDCLSEFEPFLKFLYTASIELNLNNVIGILCLADKYNVESLKGLCQNYMIDHCKSPRRDNVQNALVWYPLSKALHMQYLQNQSKATIAWNTKEILTSKDWLNMEYDFLQDMLGSSDLVVQSEMEIYEAVERWLLNLLDQGQTDLFIERANQLLPLVRFARMTIVELHTVENSELYQQRDIEQTLNLLIGRAFRFHSLCMAPIQDIQTKFADVQYQPRDYLDYQVDLVRVHNTLRYAMQVEVKTCPSPLPDMRRDADWRLSYRKIHSSGVWSLHIQCQDTAMNNSNSAYESTVIIYDTSDKIIQVVKPERALCKRGQAEIIDIPHVDSTTAKSMVVLIKPVVNLNPIASKTLTS